MQKLIWSLVILVAIFIAYLFWTDNNADSNPTVAMNSEELCFQSIATSTAGTSTVSIKATLSDDNTVKGSLDSRPAEKDSLTGKFSGIWTANPSRIQLDVVQDYSAEGINATTTRGIIIFNSYAVINWNGFGEAGASDQKIPKVACGTI